MTYRVILSKPSNRKTAEKEKNKLVKNPYRIALFELELEVWLHLRHVATELLAKCNTVCLDTVLLIYMSLCWRCVCDKDG